MKGGCKNDVHHVTNVLFLVRRTPSQETHDNMATEQQITPKEALELYKNTLNHNVIARYDAQVKQLLYSTSHCVIYKFDPAPQEWIKTDYQGTLALYLRNFSPAVPPRPLTRLDLQNLFCYGLILLNRHSPENFSIGLLPNHACRTLFPHGVENNGVREMNVEINDNLIIVKNVLGEIYGLWVFDEDDRQKLYKLIGFCLNGTGSS